MIEDYTWVMQKHTITVTVKIYSMLTMACIAHCIECDLDITAVSGSINGLHKLISRKHKNVKCA